MQDQLWRLTRRALVAASFVVLSGAYTHASAAEMTAAEKDTLKVVEGFLAAWQGHADPEKIAALVNDDFVIKLPGRDAVKGKAAATEVFVGLLKGGKTYEFKIDHSFVQGSLYSHSRIETINTPDKPPVVVPLSAVYIVKNGKIQEWYEWVGR